jgi:hypothetical protein
MHTITLEKGLATFLDGLNGKNRSSATIRAYQTDISQFILTILACSHLDTEEVQQLPVGPDILQRLIQRTNDDQPGALPAHLTDQYRWSVFLVWRLLAVPAPKCLNQSFPLEDRVVFLSAFLDRGCLQQILEDIPQGPLWVRTRPQIDNIPDIPHRSPDCGDFYR